MARTNVRRSTGALLLLLAASTCWAAPLVDSSASPTPSDGDSSASLSPVGKLRVKAGASRFLAAGNTLSATGGDIRIRGFDARVKFRNIALQGNRAAGAKDTRQVRMPFTKQLEQISNRAAATSVRQEPDVLRYQPYGSVSSITAEDRRQRALSLLRAILPVIRRRLILMRIRQFPEATQAKSTGDTEGRDPCSKPSVESAERESSFSRGSNITQEDKIAALTAENARLHRTVRALALAVRGLLRHSLKLHRKLALQKQQNSSESTDSPPSSDTEKDSTFPPSGFRPMEASSMESPQQLTARRIILLRQYPSPPVDQPLR